MIPPCSGALADGCGIVLRRQLPAWYYYNVLHKQSRSQQRFRSRKHISRQRSTARPSHDIDEDLDGIPQRAALSVITPCNSHLPRAPHHGSSLPLFITASSNSLSFLRLLPKPWRSPVFYIIPCKIILQRRCAATPCRYRTGRKITQAHKQIINTPTRDQKE